MLIIMYTSIANTRLIGALSVMNNKGILLTKTAYQNEYDFLKKETDFGVRCFRFKIYCTWKCNLCK